MGAKPAAFYTCPLAAMLTYMCVLSPQIRAPQHLGGHLAIRWRSLLGFWFFLPRASYSLLPPRGPHTL